MRGYDAVSGDTRHSYTAKEFYSSNSEDEMRNVAITLSVNNSSHLWQLDTRLALLRRKISVAPDNKGTLTGKPGA